MWMNRERVVFVVGPMRSDMQERPQNRQSSPDNLAARGAIKFALPFHHRIEALNRRLMVLGAIADRGVTGPAEAAHRLTEIEDLARALDNLSRELEAGATKLPPQVAKHSRVEILRDAVASANASIEGIRTTFHRHRYQP